MKENLIKLRRIERKVDLSVFYSISVVPSEIQLQGKFNERITKFLKPYKFTMSIDDNGYLNFERNNITITLTT